MQVVRHTLQVYGDANLRVPEGRMQAADSRGRKAWGGANGEARPDGRSQVHSLVSNSVTDCSPLTGMDRSMEIVRALHEHRNKLSMEYGRGAACK